MLYLSTIITDGITNYSYVVFIFTEFTDLVQAQPPGTNKTFLPAAQGRRRLPNLPNLRSDHTRSYICKLLECPKSRFLLTTK
jgi:hypothetical protein